MVYYIKEIFNNYLTQMQIPFNKYHGTGNDFIIIDNREGIFNPSDAVLINKLCHRRFGIGADGLILVSLHKQYNYEMKYFNADGKEGSMCGNGEDAPPLSLSEPGLPERSRNSLLSTDPMKQRSEMRISGFR